MCKSSFKPLKKPCKASAKKGILFVFVMVLALFLFAEEESDLKIGDDSDNDKLENTAAVKPSAGETTSSAQAGANLQNDARSSQLDLAVNERPRSASTGLLQLVVALIIVCILAYVILKFLKKSTKVFGVDDPYLKTVASMNISQNKSIHVISLGEKAYIIGVTDSAINPIAEVDDKNLIDAMNLEASKKSGVQNKDFASVFAKFFPKFNPEEKKLGKDFFARQSERVKNAARTENIQEENTTQTVNTQSEEEA